jgi:hypothetical protein
MTTCGNHFLDALEFLTCTPATPCRSCLMAEVERLLAFARAVVAIMESNDPAITDTVWMPGSGDETLYDAALCAVEGPWKHHEVQEELEIKP